MCHNYHLQRILEHLSNLYIAICSNCGKGSPGSSARKESTCSAGDLGLIPGLGRALGGEHSNPLQYYSLEKPHGQRSLMGYSPRGHKESDRTEQLSTAHNCGGSAVKNAPANPGDLS